MDMTTIVSSAGQAVSALDGALEDKPTGLSRLLLAYGPPSLRQFLTKGRLRLIHLRHREAVLEETFKVLIEEHRRISINVENGGADPLDRVRLGQLERDYRLLSTFKLALPNLPESEESVETVPSESDALWWDMFEDLASRRNEVWRRELFARSVVLNDGSPGEIGFKALWEIAMMEADDFSALSVFCDSSLYIDGKPVILMEVDEQYRYELDLDDFYKGNLALCVSRLIDKNLIQKVATQFMTTEPVELKYQSGKTYLVHRIEGVGPDAETAVRVDGYAPTDHCLDICKLYEAKLNIASVRSLELLQAQLEDESIQSVEGSHKSSFEFVSQI